MGTVVSIFDKYHGFHFWLCHYVSIGTCVPHFSLPLQKTGLFYFVIEYIALGDAAQLGYGY